MRRRKTMGWLLVVLMLLVTTVTCEFLIRIAIGLDVSLASRLA